MSIARVELTGEFKDKINDIFLKKGATKNLMAFVVDIPLTTFNYYLKNNVMSSHNFFKMQCLIEFCNDKDYTYFRDSCKVDIRGAFSEFLKERSI